MSLDIENLQFMGRRKFVYSNPKNIIDMTFDMKVIKSGN